MQDTSSDDMEVDAELDLAPEDASEVSARSGPGGGGSESNEEVEETDAEQKAGLNDLARQESAESEAEQDMVLRSQQAYQAPTSAHR